MKSFRNSGASESQQDSLLPLLAALLLEVVSQLALLALTGHTPLVHLELLLLALPGPADGLLVGQVHGLRRHRRAMDLAAAFVERVGASKSPYTRVQLVEQEAREGWCSCILTLLRYSSLTSSR